MSSKVYFTDLHVGPSDSLLSKFEKLIIKAGIDEIDFKDKFVAIKIHFGEVGNLAFLRHQYARILCDHIKKQGGIPFLTDCNTLYVGYRNNAINHLEAAMFNGYTPLSTGVQNIIADGLRGTDERLIPVEGGEYVKEAKIGAAIAEADILISLSHFKGHISAGFGGTLKNIGMGSGSKAGKMEMHSSGSAKVYSDVCIGCGMCEKHCANNGVHVTNKKAVVDNEHCVGCGYCLAYCPTGAITTKWDEANPILNKKISEYTKAAINGKPHFHINMLMDVSPCCDCEGSNDVPIIPDVGMYASFDPVAIDQACVDMANAMPISPGSEADIDLSRKPECSCGCKTNGKKDVFKMVHPDTDWEAGIKHAEKLGLGTSDYELITM